MKKLKFAMFGAGFWSRFQLAAWKELNEVDCVAIYNRTRSKAEELARDFGVPSVYTDPQELIEKERPDFIDIVTDVNTHSSLVLLAAKNRIPVICQKPMAPSLEEAREMLKACHEAKNPFLIHENWRWQRPIRQVKQELHSGKIGSPFRARIDMISGFPLFENQPFLRELEQFIITDLGSHILDTARFLFGEAESLYCHTHRVHKDIKGEDVATVMMKMGEGVSVLCQMAYAGNFIEHDRFPETFIFIEGEKGSIELAPDYWIRVTTKDGTHSKRYAPELFSWADPAYSVVHASIFSCNQNLLQSLTHTDHSETTAEDNIKTMELVFRSYESARDNQVVKL
jgi:D-apiose dehydrogenase